MKYIPIKVILLCLAVFLLAASVSWGVFESVPHLEDEHANYFQAKVFASGRLVNHLQEPYDAFYIPFAIVRGGKQFIKYPPGYPLILAVGLLIGQPWLINVLIAVLGILSCYLLGRDLFGPETGLLAAALGALSPMFILLSGAFLSNMTTLAVLTLFAWAFLRSRKQEDPHDHPARRGAFALAAGGLMGLALITRPYTSAIIGLPFAILAMSDLIRRPGEFFPIYLRMAFLFLLVGALLPLFNLAVTGSPFTNPYQLWWPYDTVGFGPDVGRNGHTWAKVVINLKADWPIFNETVLGWPVWLGIPLTWVAVGLGLVLKPWDRREWALLIPPMALIVAYMAYWAHSGGLYGVRYYTESLPYFWILAARALIKLSQVVWARRLMMIALPVFITWGIVAVTIPRFTEGHNLYHISRKDAETISASGIQNALVFVRTRQWTDYANLSWLNAGDLENSSVIFAKDLGTEKNLLVIQEFPGRAVYLYDRYQSQPLSLYPSSPGTSQ